MQTWRLRHNWIADVVWDYSNHTNLPADTPFRATSNSTVTEFLSGMTYGTTPHTQASSNTPNARIFHNCQYQAQRQASIIMLQPGPSVFIKSPSGSPSYSPGHFPITWYRLFTMHNATGSQSITVAMVALQICPACLLVGRLVLPRSSPSAIADRLLVCLWTPTWRRPMDSSLASVFGSIYQLALVRKSTIAENPDKFWALK